MNLIEQIKVNDVSIDGYQGTYYTENLEYVKTTIDAEGKILEGIKTDGSKYIGGDLQVDGNIINDGIQETLDTAVKEMQEEVNEILEDSSEVLSCLDVIDNPEFIQVTTDSEGKIIEATRKDGKKVFFGEIEGVDTLVNNEVARTFQNKSTLDKFSEESDNLLWNDNIVNSSVSPIISLENNEYTIKTKSVNCVFKRVIDNSIHLDTWRFYSMAFPGGFTVFSAIDVEGVIKLQGENDFLGGFHGSEIATNFKVLVDGVDVTEQTFISERKCHIVEFFVESDVYHCYDSQSSQTVAFKRNKIITFENDKFTISTYWKALDDFIVVSAPTSLFSINKWIGFNAYYVNSDYKLYDPTDYDNSHPADDKEMNHSVSFLNVPNIGRKRIDFKNTKTSNQNYEGFVTDFDSRLKYYFSTVKGNSETPIAENSTIISESIVEIY